MQQTQTAQLSTAATDVNVVVQAVLAMALGLFVVGVVGFSHISAVHNARMTCATPMPFPAIDPDA